MLGAFTWSTRITPLLNNFITFLDKSQGPCFTKVGGPDPQFPLGYAIERRVMIYIPTTFEIKQALDYQHQEPTGESEDRLVFKDWIEI